MPIYEYRCVDCDAELEIVVTGGQEPVTCGRKCQFGPKVRVYGGGKLERKMSAPAVIRTNGVPVGDGASADAMGRKGFAAYQNEGDGTYTRIAGEGPNRLTRTPGSGS